MYCRFCSLAVHIVLEETGISYNTVKVDNKTKTTEDGSDYLKINTKGAVPALRTEEGVIITEASAILQYVADLKSAHSLLPPVPTLERYRVLETLSLLVLDLYKNYVLLYTFPDEAKPKAKTILLDRYNLLEKQLEGHDFLNGNIFSIADAYFYTLNRWHGWAGIDLPSFKNISAFQKRVGDRHSIQQVLKAEGI